ncbi:MAG: hypothetical protein AAGA11_14255 [Pseudomonadota bacterium]
MTDEHKEHWLWGYKNLATLGAVVALSSAVPLGLLPERYIGIFAPKSADQINELVLAVARLYAGLLATVGMVLGYSRDSRLSRARNALVLMILVGSGVLFVLNLQLLLSGISGFFMVPLLLCMAALFGWSLVRYRTDFAALRVLRASGQAVP